MHLKDFGDPPKLTLSHVGGYQFSDNHFLRVWCDDPGTCRQALLERALGIATMPETLSTADLLQRTDELARALEVSGSVVPNTGRPQLLALHPGRDARRRWPSVHSGLRPESGTPSGKGFGYTHLNDTNPLVSDPTSRPDATDGERH